MFDLVVIVIPFGFEQKEYEKSLDKPEVTNIKRKYLKVNAMMTKDRKITPLSLFWDDGREFHFKVISSQLGRSSKTWTTGMRYTCQCGTKTFYPYFDDNRFYVELNPYPIT